MMSLDRDLAFRLKWRKDGSKEGANSVFGVCGGLTGV